MLQDAYTENLADFGYREIKMLRDLLDAWVKSGLPDGFENDGVKAAMNLNRGFVFLTNAEFQVCMDDHEKLYLFHSLPYGGAEGSIADLMSENTPDSLHADDVEYIRLAPEFNSLVASGNYPAWEEKEAA